MEWPEAERRGTIRINWPHVLRLAGRSGASMFAGLPGRWKAVYWVYGRPSTGWLWLLGINVVRKDPGGCKVQSGEDTPVLPWTGCRCRRGAGSASSGRGANVCVRLFPCPQTPEMDAGLCLRASGPPLPDTLLPSPGPPWCQADSACPRAPAFVASSVELRPDYCFPLLSKRQRVPDVNRKRPSDLLRQNLPGSIC